MKDMKDDTMELIIDYVNFPPRNQGSYTFSIGEVWSRIYKYDDDYWVVEDYNYDDWSEENEDGGYYYGTTIVNLRTMSELNLCFREDLGVEDIEKILEKGITDSWYTNNSVTGWRKKIQEFYLTYIKEHYENTRLQKQD